jgi:hypothetical protein
MVKDVTGRRSGLIRDQRSGHGAEHEADDGRDDGDRGRLHDSHPD